MSALVGYSHLLTSRAELLVLALTLGAFLGGAPARWLGLEALSTRITTALDRLKLRLDREQRSIGTRIYRGLLITVTLVLLAILFGALLARPHALLLTLIVLSLCFGRKINMYESWALWRRAKNETTPLELPRRDHLFPDGHALVRYCITTLATNFASILGACVWFMLTGLPGMFGYLMLSVTHHHFGSAHFGWAARQLFTLANLIPAVLERILIGLAALLTPGVKTSAIFSSKHWLTFTANLLSASLGGPTPEGNEPWVGNGTARLTHADLRRALVLYTTATLLLIVTLASLHIYNILKNIIS